MAYNNAIPQAADLLSQSQDDILNNFVSIKTLVDVNHVTFDAINQGKHNFVEFPEQVVVPVTIANEVGLYGRASAITGTTELVYVSEASATRVEFTSSVKNVVGYAVLPSGIIYKWGTGLIAPNAALVVNFCNDPGVPAFTNVYNIQTSMVGNVGETGNIYVQANNLLTVTLAHTGAGNRQYYYLAIGD